MKKSSLLFALVFLVAPIAAHAGIADFFGIGTVAKSISDATWKIYGIKTLAAMGPLILLITAVISAIFVANSVANITKSFAATAREVLIDGKVIGTERKILVVQSILSGLAVLLLMFVGFYLALLIKAGTNEMLHYSVPAEANSPVASDIKKK